MDPRTRLALAREIVAATWRHACNETLSAESVAIYRAAVAALDEANKLLVREDERLADEAADGPLIREIFARYEVTS